MTVSVTDVSKRFGQFPALHGVTLDTRPGEFLALLGPSGSGKTTLLRIIAGLEFPDAGRVAFEGVDVSDRPTRDRSVGFVFQHYALFRHMTVAQNIAFGLTVRRRRDRPARAEIDRRVAELLALVKLPDVGGRYPAQLSGGQRQRIALARALAVEPRLLLLDEPFGALDAKVRKELRRWLRDIHDETGLTSVFVTHDQEEALELADRVVVMNHGVIEQVGTPDEVYDKPATAFVCDFLGDANRFEAAFEPGAVRIGALSVGADDAPSSGAGVAFIRPQDFAVEAAGQGMPATVRKLFRAGRGIVLECALPDGRLVEAVTRELPSGVEAGSSIGLVAKRVRAYAA